MEQEGGKTGSFLDCSQIVIGACIEVHRHLGPGLLESAYERCLCHELRQDLVVSEQVLVENKAVAKLLPVHEAQVITYLKLSGLPTGLLVNFQTAVIKHGLRRLTHKQNNLPAFPPSFKP